MMNHTKYAYLITAFLLFLMVGGGIGYLLNRSKEDASERYGALYFDAAVRERSSDFNGTMNRIALEGKGGYVTLSKLQLASAYIAASDNAGASSIYMEVAKDHKTNKFLVEYSNYMLSMIYAELGNTKELAAIPDNGPVFGPHIKEVKGFFALRVGDSDASAKIFGDLVNDIKTPASVRNRAMEIISYLKS